MYASIICCFSCLRYTPQCLSSQNSSEEKDSGGAQVGGGGDDDASLSRVEPLLPAPGEEVEWRAPTPNALRVRKMERPHHLWGAKITTAVRQTLERCIL